MAKSKIIMADIDEKFLFPLEMKFLSELNDDTEIELISSPVYFEEYFSEPKSAAVLLVSEAFYTPELHKHNIKHIVIMAERDQDVTRTGLSVFSVNKYTSLDDIYSFTISLLNEAISNNTSKETEVILVASASGGTGKTTISIGLSAALASRYKKVLYINAENMNSFQYWMTDMDSIPVTACATLSLEEEIDFHEIEQYIKHESFDYLSSFSTSLMSLNLDLSVYEKIISGAKKSNKYDAIVVDTDAAFDFAKISLITKADKVIIVTNESKASIYATNRLTKNISCNNDEKFFFICNDFSETALLQSGYREEDKNFTVNETVNTIEKLETFAVDQLGDNTDIKKLSYLIM